MISHSAARAASSAGGQLLRAATGLVAARPAAKPLHPRGSVVRGPCAVSVRSPGPARRGWTGPARTRGARPPVPSRRVPGPRARHLRSRDPGVRRWRHGVLLFASTGLGRADPLRPDPGRSPYARPMTTLLPYRTRAGAVLLSAEFRDEATARPGMGHRSGEWHPFAELALHQVLLDEADLLLSFDPVRNTLPGLGTYEVVRRLRGPAYATARRSRRRRCSAGRRPS